MEKDIIGCRALQTYRWKPIDEIGGHKNTFSLKRQGKVRLKKQGSRCFKEMFVFPLYYSIFLGCVRTTSLMNYARSSKKFNPLMAGPQIKDIVYSEDFWSKGKLDLYHFDKSLYDMKSITFQTHQVSSCCPRKVMNNGKKLPETIICGSVIRSHTSICTRSKTCLVEIELRGKESLCCLDL